MKPIAIITCVIIAVHLIAVHSAPVTSEIRLLSQVSGRFVRVAENGDIMANENQKSSSVFNMYLKNSQVQFELKNKPGMFLMLKELNNSVVEDVANTTSSSVNITANQISIRHEYALVVDYPFKSLLTVWEKSGLCGALIMKVNDDAHCSVAFDSSGKVAGPCNLLATDSAGCISVLRASS
eukprot:Em0017g755a